VYFAHPFLVFAAAAGVAAVLWPIKPGRALFGAAGFFAWGFAEALQQAFSIVALNRVWREGFATATSAAARARFETYIGAFDGIWDSFYLLLLTAFLVANLLYGSALLGERGFARVIGVFFLAAAGLTVLIWLENFADIVFLDRFTDQLYPAIQPLGRFLTGVWLWRESAIDRRSL